MTYDIRKATGRGQKSGTIKTDTETIKRQDVVATKPVAVKDARHHVENGTLHDQINLFDTIVTHNYLTELSRYPIVKYEDEHLPQMGWWRITKMVLDKETFFPDQLSMLYTALHDVAANVALVIDKKQPDDIEIYIGARDFIGNDNNFNASLLLDNAIQGYLPGVKTETVQNIEFVNMPKDQTDKATYVASYSGIASLRDDKKDNFVQGIEKFLDATPSIPAFTAFFIADNVSLSQASKMINAFSSLENAISPLVQYQETLNQSETSGVSSTITDTIGKTITESLSETVTHTEGTNSSHSKSVGNTTYGGVGASVSLFGLGVNAYYGEANSSQYQEQYGSHVDQSLSNQKGSSDAKNKQKSTAKGTNSSTTVGLSLQVTKSNCHAKRYVELIERHIKRLQNGSPFGLWSVGTYFLSPAQETSLKLANIYKGCITGEWSYIDASAVNVWDKKDSTSILSYLKNTRNPRFLVSDINVSSGVLVTSKEMSIQMSLPQTSIPGIEVRERVAFGRNLNRNLLDDSSNKKDRLIPIGQLSHLGNISKQKVSLDVEELSKHVFITGSTGSGKSNTTYLLINSLLEKRKTVLVVEPTKGDYRKVFGGREGFIVYGTRPNEKNLLRINPFAFPSGIRVDEHVERLVEIFGVCWPMYAAMPEVLKESISEAYKACGWNLNKSDCKYGKLFPTIADVIIQLKRIIASSEYSSDTKGDYVGALQTRLQSLTNGVYASILSTNPIPYDELYDKNAIIDLHRIGSSETRALLMGLIVLGLTEWRQTRSEDSLNEDLKHVTVLEEAHCILPRVSKQKNQEGSNVIGKSVEMIAASIAEMRSYGQGFVI